MKQEWKEKWIKALRSGRYKQTQGMLRDIEGGMCCLGVLGNLAVKEKLAIWDGCDAIKPVDIVGRKASASLLPITWAKDTFGLSSSQQEQLVGMNDWEGKSFKQIADYIEEGL